LTIKTCLIVGIYVNRGCVIRRKLQHDCDPSLASIDMDNNSTYYCTFTCEGNACNRHSVDTILSKGDQLYSKGTFLFLIFVGCKLL